MSSIDEIVDDLVILDMNDIDFAISIFLKEESKIHD